jgi:hypothetical protein
MLLAAGVLFFMALLLWFVNSWLEDADVDLSMAVRVLLAISVMLIGFNVFSQ